MPKTDKELTVEECLAELREIFGPIPQIIVDIRDCGRETRSQHGRLEHGAQIGMNGEEFTAPTMSGVLRKVRAWHKAQELTTILPGSQQ